MSSLPRRLAKRAMRKMGYHRETFRPNDEEGNPRPLRIIGPNGKPVGLTYPRKMLAEHMGEAE